MKTRVSLFPIPPLEVREAERLARAGSWRAVLASIDRWSAKANAAGQPLDPVALEAIGAAGLCRKGVKVTLGILDRKLLPHVPLRWLQAAAMNAQDEILADLVQRSAGILAADVPGLPCERGILERAVSRNLSRTIDALVAKGFVDPAALSYFIDHPNEEIASSMVPRLVALGASPSVFPPFYSFAACRQWGTYPTSPLGLALRARRPAFALALIKAGASPLEPVRSRRNLTQPDTTVLHVGLGEMLSDIAAPVDSYPAAGKGEDFNDYRIRITRAHHAAVQALLHHVAGTQAWWHRDARQRRPSDVEGRFPALALRWLAEADARAHLAFLPPASEACPRPRPRL